MPCKIYQRFTREIERLWDVCQSQKGSDRSLAMKKRTDLIVERDLHAQNCADCMHG